MARNFSHFSHFGSSTHKMACQSVAQHSDAAPSKSYGYAIMSRGGRSISCETFLSLRSGTTDSQRGQPRKKNAKAKDTGGVKYMWLWKEGRLPPVLKLSYVFIRVLELFQRTAKVTSSITPLRSEQCKESDNDVASILTRTLLYSDFRECVVVVSGGRGGWLN